MDVGQAEGQPRQAFGLYIVILYSIFVGSTTALWLPAQLPLGFFTLEGRSVQRALVAWSAAWLLTVIGLSLRKRWGYYVAMMVFGLHVLIMVSNTLLWFSHNEAPVRIVIEVAIWPMLQRVLPALLVLAYLYERSELFSRSRRAS